LVFTIPIPKENSVSIFGIKTLAGAPQKNGGSPLFPKKGGPWPLFVHCALLLKKKRIPAELKKIEFPRNLKKMFPQKLTVQKSIPTIKYRYRLYLIPDKYRYRKNNDWNHRGMQH
jgi:hypothetical protein